MTLVLPDKPKLSWEEFVAKMPPGRAPQVRDIFDRWASREDILSKDKPPKKIGERMQENGEERAFLAWVAGVMEYEEQRYFSMMTVRIDALASIGIVPVVRELWSQQGRILSLLEQVQQRLGEIAERQVTLQQVSQ